MDLMTARPELLKQANLSLIRGVLKERGTATRAEIAESTGISSTTVRALLTEMLDSGEVESNGHDASSGGRKAERYRFRPDRYHGAAFCIRDDRADALVVNACGEIVETAPLAVPGRDVKGLEEAMSACLDGLLRRRDIRSIGIGMPGVVDAGGVWIKERRGEKLLRYDLGDRLRSRYGLPVVMENDINAIAIGFGRCYEREFPQARHEDTNMAYLYFEPGCVGAGFLAGGQILRGCRNFAGELGLVPLAGGRLLEEQMAGDMDDAAYIDTLIQVVGWVCGILNPEYIALGGPSLRKDCLGPIGDGLSSLLPHDMLAELLYAPDEWSDYHDGMAHLTAEKMFEAVRLVRE